MFDFTVIKLCVDDLSLGQIRLWIVYLGESRCQSIRKLLTIGKQGIRKSLGKMCGYQQIKKSESQDVRKSRRQDVRLLENQEVKRS